MNISQSVQVAAVAQRLNTEKTIVKTVLTSYSKYVRYCVERHKTTGYLGIVTFFNLESRVDSDETFAYQSRVVADELGLSPVLVQGILTEMKLLITDDLLNGLTYTIYSLCKISLTPKGTVTTRKSSTLHGVRVSTNKSYNLDIADILAARG